MSQTRYGRCMAALFPAAAFAVLAVLNLFFAAPGIVGVKADPGTGDEALIVLENGTGSRWSQLSRLNVFANSDYDGQPIIAPDSSGEYVFTVQNSARFPLQYTLQISDENEAGIPMEYRLKQGNEYLMGDENQWVDISALSKTTNGLPHESKAVYTLEWRWLGDDGLDTSLGIAAQDGVKYLLNVGITAEQAGEPVDPTEPSKPPQTGDTFSIALWLALAIASTILLILFIPMKRKDADNADSENA